MGKNDTSKLLRSRSFPSLAAALRATSQTILNRWLSAVRDVMPTADELTFAQLRDDIPYILENVAIVMEREGHKVTDELKAASEAHGAIRFHQSYNASELMLEYSILRTIVLEEVGQTLGQAMSLEECISMNQGLDVAVRRSVMNFVNHLTREMQVSSEAQSKYLSFLSHDLRGGLNGVVLMMEVLKRELAAEPRFSGSLDDLEVMRRAILDTVGTMDRFLHAERFRKGKVQVKPTLLDLKALVGDICGQFAYQARDLGMQIEQSVPADLRLISDKDLLSLIFQNLLSNAIKYGKGGPVKIVASLRPDGRVRAEVQDHGHGIASEKLKQLFTPFTRGETHGQSGMGLGLSIARQAADMLHAKLWAESEVGNGSTFYLELPADSTAS